MIVDDSCQRRFRWAVGPVLWPPAPGSAQGAALRIFLCGVYPRIPFIPYLDILGFIRTGLEFSGRIGPAKRVSVALTDWTGMLFIVRPPRIIMLAVRRAWSWIMRITKE